MQNSSLRLAGEADSFAAVAAVLWSEREMLENVLYALVQEQLVLSSGATRWLNRADAAVHGALQLLRSSEVVRAAEVESLAASLHLPPETTLAELAAIAPDPWPVVLSEHRSALRELVSEIDAVATENREQLHAAAGAIRQTLDQLAVVVAGYEEHGGVVRFRGGPVRLSDVT